MNGHPSDKLVAGVLAGALLTAVFVVGMLYLGIPAEHHANMAMRLGAPVALSCALLFPMPLLHRTVMRERRSEFLLDEDLNAMLLGRAIGVIGGVALGVTLATEML
ncbi:MULTISPECIES: hypothetical protein [Paraburkholderia]|uniref:Uncharacterized protein n=2 Tax=Paraburkholderia TaxID=1822464 RepID=A0A7Z7BGS3_9BURK|nr:MULTISPECIES: hypothetical protein [Paraburkholderia]AUT62135.1 hypothetical protein C2L65_21025 [Paraburkholderia terrae]BCZ79711.1 hypothetical protein PTKU64_33860 [Paraburkholderia terrae]BDC41822.1 hypothetical protein PTKU15_51190 [Paraburkholderia terrae]SDJ20303.1 hypothetical protein SAMN04487926_13734 [Paraburkholderia steynii]